MQSVIVVLILIPLMAMSAHAGVVSGSFFYIQEGDGSLIQYHVNAVDYKGIAAWRIVWDCDQMKAEHFIRRSDGAPLYVKRTIYSLNLSIEISYSTNGRQPSIYRRRSENEYIERKIWDAGLRDLGALPQLLLGKSRQELGQDIVFSAINYDDGKVYHLIAKRAGFRNVTIDGVRVRCLIYDVTVDSWLSVFVGKTRLLIPISGQNSNFVAYSGPGLDGVADFWSIRLIGRDKTLAMLKAASVSP